MSSRGISLILTQSEIYIYTHGQSRETTQNKTLKDVELLYTTMINEPLATYTRTI